MSMLEARLVISGANETDPMFAEIKGRIAALAEQVAAVGKASQALGGAARDIGMIAREIGDAAKATDRMAASLSRVREHASRAHREVGGLARALTSASEAVAPAFGVGALFLGYGAARHVAGVVFERQHERVRMEAAGMTASEVADAEATAGDLSRKYTAVSQTDIMHMLRNTRSVVGDFAEAKTILDPMLALRTVAQAAHPDANLDEDFDKLIKALEIKGVTQNPEKFKAFIGAMGKDILAFGDTLKPVDFYEAFKLGRQSTQALSMEYMTTVGPKLIQELGGAGAGVAQQAFYTAVVGGHMSKTALAMMERFDLVDRSKVISPRGGHLANAAGAVKDWRLAAENPYQWVNKVLLPALAKRGITDPAKILQIISAMFSKNTAAQLVGLLATQQPSVEKDTKIVHETMDTYVAARKFMTDDPTIAARGVENAFDNLITAVTHDGDFFAHQLSEFANDLQGAADDVSWWRKKWDGFWGGVDAERRREKAADAAANAPPPPVDYSKPLDVDHFYARQDIIDRMGDLTAIVASGGRGLGGIVAAKAAQAELDRLSDLESDIMLDLQSVEANNVQLARLRGMRLGLQPTELDGREPGFAPPGGPSSLEGAPSFLAFDALGDPRGRRPRGDPDRNDWLAELLARREEAEAKAEKSREAGRARALSALTPREIVSKPDEPGFSAPGAPYLPRGLPSHLAFGALGDPRGRYPWGAPGPNDWLVKFLGAQAAAEAKAEEIRENSRAKALSAMVPRELAVSVTGQARSEVTVRVEAGSDLLRIEDRVRRLTDVIPLSATGAARAGRMDDDAAPARGIGHQ